MKTYVVRRATVLTVAALCLALVGGTTGAANEAKVPVETFTLDNGMEFLFVPMPEKTTVSAGWVAHVGSANERPGITGLSHLFEHMMFKGTDTIGTNDAERDLEIIAEQEVIQERIREIYREQRERWRRGEIDDPFDPENRTEEQIELEAQFQALVEEQRALMVKDEFDKIYTESGASGMNAFTTNDMTFYFITVPANKLELWFWMESDRLANPVFREFYSERDVVHEERRLRTESTPTGKFEEQFDAMFWESHPYSWPVIGWPSDLRVISKEQADEYYNTYYSPNNLTAALVGDFDVDEAKALAQKYFGRLERGRREPPDVVTLEVKQLAEKRMNAECDCQPQVEVRYHTVPFRHADTYALDVLAGLLNGRTGRLYKSMVLGEEIASSAFAGQDSSKYAGAFSFGGETKGDATPEQLEQALVRGARAAEERSDSRRRAAEGQEPDRGRLLPASAEPVLPDVAADVLRGTGRLEVPQRMVGRDARRHRGGRPARGQDVLHAGEPDRRDLQPQGRRAGRGVARRTGRAAERAAADAQGPVASVEADPGSGAARRNPAEGPATEERRPGRDAEGVRRHGEVDRGPDQGIERRRRS